ncbi:MAG: hypothetical protein JWO05_1729 [Gemmatimonadetes bacterium]|nr:hypothetical protein [Gemmatimonadota bacterium]
MLVALWWHLWVQLALRVLSYARVRALLSRFERAKAAHADTDTMRRILVGNDRATRLMPGSACLQRALVGHVLLARQGIASEVRIGARLAAPAGAHSPGARAFDAHAWLELPSGERFSGGVAPSEFAVLTPHPR